MASGRVLDEGVLTRRGRSGEQDASEERAAQRPYVARGPGSRLGTLIADLVLAVLRVFATTVGVAFGFSLLVFGVGRPILGEVARMGDPGRADGGDGGGTDVMVAALKVMGWSWRELVPATLRFSLGVAILATPLSLLSFPVLWAVGLEPSARIASLEVEVAVGWGAALALAAVGALLIALVPAGLRRLTEMAAVSPQSAGSASANRAVGR